MKEWHEQADLARASLDKAAKKMKKWADERRRHVEFEWRDLPDSEASWEAEDLLWQFTDEIKRYHEDEALEASWKSVELYIVASGSSINRGGPRPEFVEEETLEQTRKRCKW
ncbi:gag-aspartyl protease domain-containing protein, partial [Tanacetum coccineum]